LLLMRLMLARWRVAARMPEKWCPKGTIFPDHVSRSDRRPAVSTVEQKKMNRASRVFCDISTMAVSFSTVKAALHT
jgi:hypothetical protein